MNSLEQDQALQRKQELSDFLVTRRNRLLPEQVGLPRGTRRRTPGLRRDEVAQLAGVSVDWYTWLEQGRSISVSTQVLESLVQALRLDDNEREHLFLLAHQQLPPQKATPQEAVSPYLQHFLDQLGNSPAYAVDQRWNVVAWNDAARLLLCDFTQIPAEERNIVWLTFMFMPLRQILVDWERHAQRVVAQFRASSGHLPGDPQLTEVINKLLLVSPEFQLWWSQHEIVHAPEGVKVYNHPQLGQLAFEYLMFQLYNAPDMKVTIYTPVKASDTAQKVEQFLQTSNISKI